MLQLNEKKNDFIEWRPEKNDQLFLSLLQINDLKCLKLILGSVGTDWCSGSGRKTRPNGENVAQIK